MRKLSLFFMCVLVVVIFFGLSASAMAYEVNFDFTNEGADWVEVPDGTSLSFTGDDGVTKVYVKADWEAYIGLVLAPDPGGLGIDTGGTCPDCDTSREADNHYLLKEFIRFDFDKLVTLQQIRFREVAYEDQASFYSPDTGMLHFDPIEGPDSYAVYDFPDSPASLPSLLWFIIGAGAFDEIYDDDFFIMGLTVDNGYTYTPVPLDIKPGTCPNPLNVKSKGVLPVAIMGTAAFDVTQVAPDTLRLELKNGDANGGIAPLQWAFTDVGEPYMPYMGKEDCELDCAGCSCPDEIMDLVLNFDSQELVSYLGEVTDGDCYVLKITGNLSEDSGGNPIYGEDVLLILKKGK